jgi:uncharacterized membrane protein YdbT with pleckstrin-like domain
MGLKLTPGEQVLFEGHPSWRSIVGFYLKGFSIVAIVAAIAVAANLSGDADKGLVTLIALAGVVIVLIVGFIKRVATDYTVTNRRLHIRRGIISREIQETRLERVQNVNYRQSIYQRLMRIGDVDFDTAAGDDYQFGFFGIGSPGEVVAKVDKAASLSGVASGDSDPL